MHFVLRPFEILNRSLPNFAKIKVTSFWSTRIYLNQLWNTTLYLVYKKVRKSWFRLACQEWVRLASSSSSQEPRLTANIRPTVNMFWVAVYYLTSVQDTSATPGPCSRTAHRYTLLETHWRTCGVRTSRSSSLTCGSQTARTWIQSITLFMGALQQMVYQRRRFVTINQLKQAIVIEWGKLLQHFIDRAIGHWRRRLECVVQQQGGHIEHLM